MQQTFKKVVATTLGLALILTMILFIMPVQTANADTVVWEKVDYKNYLKSDPLYTDGAGAYYGNVNEIPYFRQFNYLYIFAVGGGGMGGSSADGNPGYGGGAGAFCVVKINLRMIESIHIIYNTGGGKFESAFPDEFESGSGGGTGILTTVLRDAPNYGSDIDAIVLEGGRPGSSTTPGRGGNHQYTNKRNSINIIHVNSGADGGQASHSFSVDLGFRTEHFIYRPMGAYPSGKGGGASVYHRGGDGGVMFKNGSDGVMGAGGGGAGKGATQGGFGGDGYVEVYGSNM